MSLYFTAITILLLLFALWVILSRPTRKTLGILASGIFWFAYDSYHLCLELLRGRPATTHGA